MRFHFYLLNELVVKIKKPVHTTESVQTAQSDQNLVVHFKFFKEPLIINANRQNFDQTMRMPRHI